MSSSLSQKKMEEGEEGRKGKSSIIVIFRYADWIDIFLMCLGTLGAIGDGMSTNCLLLYVSHLFNSLGYGNNSQISNGNLMREVEKVSIYLFFSKFYFRILCIYISPISPNQISFFLTFFFWVSV